MNPVHPWLDAEEVKRLAEQLMRPPPTQDSQALQNAGFGREFVGFAGGEVAPAIPAEREVPIPPQPSRPAVPTPVPLLPPTAVEAAPAPAPTPAPTLPPAPAPTLSPAPTLPPVPAPILPPAPAPTLPPAPAPILPPAPPPAPPMEASATPEPLPSPRTSFLERIRQYRDWMHTQFSATGLFLLDREGAVIFDEGTHGKLHFLARSLALASRRPGTAATNVHVKIGVGATLEVIPVDTPFGCLVLGAVVPDALGQDAVHLIREGLVRTVRHPDNPTPQGSISAQAPLSGSLEAPAQPPA